jgi:hypothetical protein
METPSPPRARRRPRKIAFDVEADVEEIGENDKQLVAHAKERNLNDDDDNDVNDAVSNVSFTLDSLVIEPVDTHNMTRDEIETKGGEDEPATPFTPLRKGTPGSPAAVSIFSVSRSSPQFSSFSANSTLVQLSPVHRVVLFERGAAAFEVYASPAPGLVRPDGGAVSAQRMFGNTEHAASFFELAFFSISRGKKGSVKASKKIVSDTPAVKEGSLFETGRCMFTFHPFPDYKDPYANRENDSGAAAGDVKRRQKSVGAFSIRRSLFPAKLVSTTRDSDMMLSVNPLLLIPADRQVTVLMPEDSEAFKGLDHIVLELTNADNGHKLASIAIHKSVFVSLLMIDRNVITFHSVVITPTVSIGIRMYVSRIMRSAAKRERVYVNIDRVEFSVPDGFEKVYFPNVQRRVRFEDDTRIAWRMAYVPPSQRK